MMAKIKFCGLTRAEDIRAVNRLKADYAGFVFWPKSKRYVTRDKASELSELLSASSCSLGKCVLFPGVQNEYHIQSNIPAACQKL